MEAEWKLMRYDITVFATGFLIKTRECRSRLRAGLIPVDLAENNLFLI